jgi:hypothetical protein
MRHLHTFLELRETGQLVLEGHDFAISDEGIDALLTKGSGYLRIFLVQPVSIA